ncbi:MBL fold metallo-hydrolase [Spirochaetia bacterium]|nr:MBL fold metallo-hydrolase [Spirochaetia bacterium]
MNNTLVTKQLEDNIWTFNEAVETTGPQMDAYLVTGSKKAVMIDTLQDETHLYSKVRELTKLPIDVLITHGHRDHCGIAAKDFFNDGCPVYMDERDNPLMKAQGWDTAMFKPLRAGDIFDLGGYKLETIALPGHTPGSAVFLEREKQHLYTGDATGAGVFWMQIPNARPLSEFRSYLGKLWEEVKDMKNLKLLTGHRHQAPIHDLEFLKDTIYVTDKILSGEMKGEPKEMKMHDGKILHCMTVKYKTITDYAYNSENL